MALDDVDSVQHFISRMRGQSQKSDLTAATLPSTPHHIRDEHPSTPHHGGGEHPSTPQVTRDEQPSTPHHSRDEHPSNFDTDGPEAHPKPSPNLSGLTAPQNTPKTFPWSPQLTATNLHNQHVADAFSDYVNAMIGRPLSESIWAPGFARRKPSMLNGAPSDAAAKVLTPVKGVDPIVNETFKRMSFQVADHQGSVGENLIGDSNTNLMFSKASPSFINKLSSKDVEIPAPASKKGSDTQAYPPNTVKKENEPPTSKSYLPPHLRGTQSSVKHSNSSTGAPAQATSSLKGLLPETMSKVTDPSPVKSTVSEVELTDKTTSGGAKSPTHASSATEDLEHKIFFNAWPKLEDRARPAAKVRTIIIKDLPRGSTATFVSSLVYGGPIEEINVRSSAAGDLTAVVRFMDAGDCAKYYEETSNGIVWEKEAKGHERVLFVELSKDVDVVGGLLQTWIASGVTRCVRAVGVEADWGMDGLVKIAERKNRKVEKIVDGQNPFNPLWQARSVEFRFCKVADAVQFKGALARDEEWEHCNIHYAPDPCASATGVHFDG